MHQNLIYEIIVSITNCFIKAKIPFCVAGGIAVSLWGHIRATEDIDIIALIDADNENQIITALQNHFKIIPHKDTMLQSTLTPIKRYVIIANSSHFVVDVLLATNDFLKHCIQNSKIFTLSGINIPVICIEDLIVMKCASGRHQDIADIQSLLAASLPVDKSYINSQIRKLNIAIPEGVKDLILQ